ncbi:50S ribosomal protein L4 [Candidatus Parcubacteria bacterium]|nr:MAG: 50S ribosomal protein L4 [Candidatus Parcubacteria bacterium]
MKTEVYSMENKRVGEIELPDGIFGMRWNPSLVEQVVLAERANRRRPWAHAKGRSEVRGGGRKPWQQKGTGRARHGSIRSPLWVGGGKAHGPNKERTYEQKINKKMKRLALFSILSEKLRQGEVKVFDSFRIEQPKTKILAQAFQKLITQSKKERAYNVLVIPRPDEKFLYRAGSNLPKTKVISPLSLNTYDLLAHKNIFIDQNAVLAIKEHYTVKKS